MSRQNELEKKYISAVVYVHNDQELLPDFLKTVMGILENNFQDWEVIFVNDGSTDGSEELIRDFFCLHPIPAVSIINMSYFQGIELSMSAGVELAVGDYVFEFDTQKVSYAEECVMEAYRKCMEGYDIVSAAPKGHAHWLSGVYYEGFLYFSNVQYKLKTEAFRIISRRAVNRTYSMSNQILYRKAAYASCGLPMERVEFDAKEKYQRKSSKERRKQREIGIDALILYTDIAYKLAMGLSFLMILFSIVCIIYIILVYLAGKPVPGYVSTFAISAFGFFGVNILLSILIKYASLILRIVFQKERYLIKSIERL